MNNDLEKRFFEFSLKAVRLCRRIGKDPSLRPISLQLTRSATSVAANYQEAQAGISRADFTNKVAIAKKEAKESLYWLRLIRELENSISIDDLINEGLEIVKILQSITFKLRAPSEKA